MSAAPKLEHHGRTCHSSTTETSIATLQTCFFNKKKSNNECVQCIIGKCLINSNVLLVVVSFE